MIDIKIRCKERQIETSYHLQDFVCLSDIGLTILELERIKQRLLEESENCEPEVEIKSGELDE